MRKEMLRTAACVAALALALTLPATAGGDRSRTTDRKKTEAESKERSQYEQRKRAQKERIKSGKEDGSLTGKEAAGLAAEQKRIEAKKRKAAADGEVTPKAKAQIKHSQDKASKQIAKERHDKDGEMGPLPDKKAWDPGVNQRQRNQKHRVGHGIRSGTLTKEELREVIGQEIEIIKTERAMKSDGVLDIEERKTLHRMLNETSRLIFEEKHDEENRKAATPPVRSDLAKKIESGELTAAEASDVMNGLMRIHQLKRILGSAELSGENRAALEANLEALVNGLYD